MYENEFYSKDHSNANQTHFHMNSFAQRLVLNQRQKTIWKWPIVQLILVHVGHHTGYMEGSCWSPGPGCSKDDKANPGLAHILISVW